jgi:hypothetical protein
MPGAPPKSDDHTGYNCYMSCLDHVIALLLSYIQAMVAGRIIKPATKRLFTLSHQLLSPNTVIHGLMAFASTTDMPTDVLAEDEASTISRSVMVKFAEVNARCLCVPLSSCATKILQVSLAPGATPVKLHEMGSGIKLTHSHRQPEVRKDIYRDPPELDSRGSQKFGRPIGTMIG